MQIHALYIRDTQRLLSLTILACKGNRAAYKARYAALECSLVLKSPALIKQAANDLTLCSS
jgi:hypothetical protein